MTNRSLCRRVVFTGDFAETSARPKGENDDVSASAEGAVKSHARRALEQGATQQDVEHAVILALTTVGFPAMIAARGWVHEVFVAKA